MRCFPFNKNGSNGHFLSGFACAEEGSPCFLLVSQVHSPSTRLKWSEILLQNRNGKGMPYIMAILDDVVTNVTAIESPPES